MIEFEEEPEDKLINDYYEAMEREEIVVGSILRHRLSRNADHLFKVISIEQVSDIKYMITAERNWCYGKVRIYDPTNFEAVDPSEWVLRGPRKEVTEEDKQTGVMDKNERETWQELTNAIIRDDSFQITRLRALEEYESRIKEDLLLDIHMLLDAGMALRSFRDGTSSYREAEALYIKVYDKYRPNE